MSARLSVNIDDETAATLRAAETTATEYVRRAVAVYAHLHAADQRGDSIRLVSPTGETKGMKLL